MRTIDADAFDRWLAAAEFDAALNNADDENRPFQEQAMYYSSQSFRDVMRHQPTIPAIPVGWLIDRANDPERAPLYRRYAQMLYEEWQKEQEAR